MSGHVRASDAEREAAAERLRAAAGEGRLDPEELEERLGRAYAARTRAELEELTGDLPATVAARPRPTPATPQPGPGADMLPPGRWTPAELRERAAGFLLPNLICLGIWVATGAHTGDFWPRWVLLFTTIALLASFVRGPDADRRRRARERADANR